MLLSASLHLAIFRAMFRERKLFSERAISSTLFCFFLSRAALLPSLEQPTNRREREDKYVFAVRRQTSDEKLSCEETRERDSHQSII